MSSVRLRSVAIVLVAVSILTVSGDFSVCQEPKEKAKGRLPAYYADIVTDAQRQRIYEVQEKYSAKLAALKQEMETLEARRDKEVEDVLDAQQKAKLKKALEAAAAKRKKSAAEKKGADEAKVGNKKAK